MEIWSGRRIFTNHIKRTSKMIAKASLFFTEIKIYFKIKNVNFWEFLSIFESWVQSRNTKMIYEKNFFFQLGNSAFCKYIIKHSQSGGYLKNNVSRPSATHFKTFYLKKIFFSPGNLQFLLTLPILGGLSCSFKKNCACWVHVKKNWDTCSWYLHIFGI